MGVWDEEGTNDEEFGAFRYMFYGEEKIETTMRAGEGHEMSEQVSVSRTGVSCTNPSESNFQVSGGLV